MSKAPGFWFFTGDWLKDPELRFCSIFARGLLVDLLCILFEANERGYASKPDGTPRSNEEIASAINGGGMQEKMDALAELESSGVLSRDNRGVLYSRRLARLNELSQKRSKAGSKRTSKSEAKAKQNGSKIKTNTQAKEDQNRGVSDSDSVSVSDSIITPPPHARDRSIVPEEIKHEWHRWCLFRESIDGREPSDIQADAVLMDLSRRGWDKAKRDIDFSIRKGAKSILDSDNDYDKRNQSSGGGRKHRSELTI